LDLDLYLMSPFDFLADPMLWPRSMSDLHGTLSASPTFGYDLVTRRAQDDVIATLDLSSWKFACCGAEPVRPEVLRNFHERFAPAGFRNSAFSPGYGLAEATLAVTGVRNGNEWNTIFVPKRKLGQMTEL